MTYKERINNRLIEYGQELLKERKEPYYTDDIKSDLFVRNNPFAFLIAVLMDQGMKAERAWSIPYLLYERLNHLEPNVIVKMGIDEIRSMFNTKPALHRFPNVMASRLYNASLIILNQYNGRANNLWSDKPKSNVLYDRLIKIDGIGQKKASMFMNMLYRDLSIEILDTFGIDVSYDVHIKRVFMRTGLSNKDDVKSILSVARKLNPLYPGVLDYPCWFIGRNFCKEINPDCRYCVISDDCKKSMRG